MTLPDRHDSLRSARLLLVAGVFVGVACSGSDPRATPVMLAPVAALPERPTPVASLPEAGQGRLAPSLARVVGGTDLHRTGDTLADVEDCAACHADVASQWRKSAHAFASFNNPV